MINLAICDDDKEFAESFKTVIQAECKKRMSDDVNVVYYMSSEECLVKQKEDNIDVYFIDIEYGDVMGHDVAKTLEKTNLNTGIVYITNHEQYVYKSFVCRPLGFVRKKCVKTDIDMAMDSICDYLEKEKKIFVFMDNRKEVPINGANIVSLTVNDHYIRIDMLDRFVEVRDKLGRLEKELCDNGFVKVSRSCIVNMKYIASVKDTDIVMTNGEKIHVSADRKVAVFYEWKMYKMKY
ncbi:MAG: response regulator transcription factor [Lachnospira sp.]|nr:response regulator transcription factor [Lachnospira sp.]